MTKRSRYGPFASSVSLKPLAPKPRPATSDARVDRILSAPVVLASLSGAGFAGVIGAYLLIVLLVFLIWPRDVNGRRRAFGCIVGLVLFFGLFVVAFASWAADHIF